MADIQHIHHDSAARTRDILVSALGTENVSHQWQIFMRNVRRELPMLVSRGRPTQQQVQNSLIGALGFKSWHEMCETPTTEGGLGLKWSQWRQWSRAYAVVDKNPGLHNAPLTAAEINRLYREAKAAEEPMPSDIDEVQAFQARQAERKKAAREETQAALKQSMEALKVDLAASQEEVARTTGAVTELREQIAAAQSQQAEEAEARYSAEQEMQQTLQDLRALHQAYQNLQTSLSQSEEEDRQLRDELSQYQNRSLFGRILAVFSP